MADRFQSTAPKCPACGKSVYVAEEVKALNGSWHHLCFCCKACGKSLRGGLYKEHDGYPYCELDQRKLFGPKGIGFGSTLGDTGYSSTDCEDSKNEVQENLPASMSLKERMAAFQRASGQGNSSVSSASKGGSALAARFQSSAPKCPACGKSVYAAEEVKALGGSWHAMCFCCKACSKSLRGGQYKEHDGQPYCEADHKRLFGPKGLGFGSTLGDTGIGSAVEQPSTVGAKDQDLAASGSLKDRMAAFQSSPTKEILPSTAPTCRACGKTVYAAEEVKALNASWHQNCFCCKHCGKSLRGGQYTDSDGYPYCEADHYKLFGPKGIGFGSTLGNTGIGSDVVPDASSMITEASKAAISA